MVYGLYYLPVTLHRTLLTETYKFDDSKILTATVRSDLITQLSTPSTALHTDCGWATRVMSARDIGAAQLNPHPYNLNAQAMDATTDLIAQVLASGVRVTEIYIDTVGPPATYQKRLERVFPGIMIRVEKKADSLFPCVSAASVCAKVTRDAALEVLAEGVGNGEDAGGDAAVTVGKAAWGSGYPGDARCSTWLKSNMDPLFGWGNECRFSWGTAKELLETKTAPCRVDWPDVEDDGDDMKLSAYFAEKGEEVDGLSSWYGHAVTEEVF